MAISFILISTSVLLFLVISLNGATAKRCTDEGTGNETTSSCRAQGSSTFKLSILGTDDKTKEMNDEGGASSAHTKSKHSNSGSNTGDSEKNTPFELPFP